MAQTDPNKLVQAAQSGLVNVSAFESVKALTLL